MYLDCVVPIPDVSGKINKIKKGNTIYIRYVVGRTYHPDKKYNIPDQRIIGKQSVEESMQMIPNENFLKYFGDIEIPEIRKSRLRSSCLHIGAFIVIRKIVEDYDFFRILGKYFSEKDRGLLLDLAAYSIICENNAGQYYPDYAYNHPLLTEEMHMYSDSKVSTFLKSVTDEQSIGFLNEWNAVRDHRERIYVSYDSTNKNCQAGDIEMVEFGHAKDNKDLPAYNYAIAYDTNNREPLFYEQYPGSIVDVSLLQFMLEKAQGYGYRHIGFILDRGYFSKENIRYMDRCGYDFVIMVKGMASLVRNLILENKGKFENRRECNIREYKTYGMTVERQLYVTDEENRYFHLFYSSQKEYAEREQVEARVEHMASYLKKQEGKAVTIGESYKRYFHLEIDPKDDVFLFARERKDVIEKEISLCGYFVIATSQKMSAKRALELYKSRDTSEKLFRGDKSYLGNRSLRVQTDESASAKIFVEFIALIIRNKIYTLLKDEKLKLEKQPNYMTVPAALKELDKIEMVRQLDGKYRLDHAVTATQKTILGAFRMSSNYIKDKANELSGIISKNDLR